MSAQLDEVRAKVQRILTNAFGSIEVDRDGDFSLRHESAHLFITCVAWNQDRVLVVLEAPFLFEVPPSPALYEYVAMHSDSWYFGHLTARVGEKGIILSMTHDLLGDYLDAAELEAAVVAVLGTANDLDDELQRTFGGVRFHEDG